MPEQGFAGNAGGLDSRTGQVAMVLSAFILCHSGERWFHEMFIDIPAGEGVVKRFRKCWAKQGDKQPFTAGLFRAFNLLRYESLVAPIFKLSCPCFWGLGTAINIA